MNGPRTPLIAALCLIVGGCTGGSSTSSSTSASTPAAPSASTVVFDCASPIDTPTTPQAGYRVFADAVALAVDPALLQPADQGRTDTFRYFAKSGLLLRPGAAITISVAPALVGKVEIGWGNTGGPHGSTLQIPACPNAPGRTGNWIVFPGGYHLNEPTCVELTIRSGSRADTARLPVGKPCP